MSVVIVICGLIFRKITDTGHEALDNERPKIVQKQSGRKNQRFFLYEEGDFPSLYLFTSEGRMEDENRLIRLLDDDDVLDSRLEVTASFGGRPVYLAVTDGMPELSHPYEIEGEFDEERFFFIDSSLGGDTSSLLGTIAVDKPAELEISMAAFSAYLEGIDQSIKDLLEASLLPDKTNPLEADNLVLTLTPTNYMRHPENLSMAAYSTSTILISRDYFFSALEQMLSSFFLQGTADIIASMLPGMIEDNLYLIKTDRAPELKERITAEFEGKDNFLYCVESTEAPWSVAIQVELTEATSLTYLFPFVFFFVALLVILTTFAELIMKERIEIGTLKALPSPRSWGSSSARYRSPSSWGKSTTSSIRCPRGPCSSSRLCRPFCRFSPSCWLAEYAPIWWLGSN